MRFSCKNIFIPILSIVFLLSISSCKKEAPKNQRIISVGVTPVVAKNVPLTHTEVGQVIAKKKIQLNARITGFLEKMNFKEGSFVEKGQLLYQIQKEQYQAQVEQSKGNLIQAQAAYDNALIEYNRQSKLIKTNATSEKDYDNAVQNKYITEGRLLDAKSGLELAELNLSYTDISAPFGGRIGASRYYPGNLVTPSSESLNELIMVDPVWVSFETPESLLVTFLQDKTIHFKMPSPSDPTTKVEGVKVSLELSNGTEYDHLGDIDFIDNQVNAQTGTIELRALFSNPKQIILPGSFVTVKIEKEAKGESLLIPQEAIQNDQSGAFVYIVGEDKKVVQKNIVTGVSFGTYIVVLKGLSKGELVITQGILMIRPGSDVSYTVNNPSESELNYDMGLTDSIKADSGKTVNK